MAWNKKMHDGRTMAQERLSSRPIAPRNLSLNGLGSIYFANRPRLCYNAGQFYEALVFHIQKLVTPG